MFGVRFKIKDFIYMFLAGLFIISFVYILNLATSKKIVDRDGADYTEIKKMLDPVDGDFIIGEDRAPVEVVFYGDFACHHCMRFVKENFLRLRDDYILTGKVKFIFRPVITLKKSLYGSKFLFCDKRDDITNAKLFYNMFEKKWMMSSDYINALMKVIKDDNFATTEHFIECMNSKTIKDNLNRLYKNTVKLLDIHETPHVFVNKIETMADKSIFSVIDKEYKKYKKMQK